MRSERPGKINSKRRVLSQCVAMLILSAFSSACRSPCFRSKHFRLFRSIQRRGRRVYNFWFKPGLYGGRSLASRPRVRLLVKPRNERRLFSPLFGRFSKQNIIGAVLPPAPAPPTASANPRLGPHLPVLPPWQRTAL